MNRLGVWNVSEINGIAKRVKVLNVSKEENFELLAMTETKLKGNGEVSWCGVNGIIACSQEMEKDKEGVAILLNDVWRSAVVDFVCVSFRII